MKSLLNLKLNNLRILCLLSLLISISACANFDTTQTGRSIGKNNMSYSGSFNFRAFDKSDISLDSDSILPFSAQARLYYGLNDNFDIGLSINSSSLMTLHSKYQIIGSKNSFYAASIGADIGCATLSTFLTKTSAYTGSFRIYNSFHLNDKFGVTFHPAYIYFAKSQNSNKLGGPYDRYANIYGLSSAVFYGKSFKVFLETSYFGSFNNDVIKLRPSLSIGFSYDFEYNNR